jgi:hypothetical protein
MADPLAMARLLMGGQPQTAGTAFEPVTWQQQLQNYKGLEGQENAWRTAEGSPWKPAEPGPVAKAIGNALTSQTGQRFMDLANFLGPGPKMPMRAMAPEGPKGIRAYHGSPHDFDRFDLSKIGTGEGAQAYGHGLYFAEAEGVANRYRDKLSPVLIKKTDGTTINPDAASGVQGIAARFLTMHGGDVPTARAALEKRNPGALQAFDELVAGQSGLQSAGRMYEVNIKADPDQFLDWDVPLSQQPEKVRKVFEDRIAPLNADLAPELKAGYDPPGSAIAKWSGSHQDNYRANADALREAGIPGIRYKDQGSRGAEGGTSNYVVFDDKLIDIVKKYGLAALLMGGATGGGSSSGNAAP